ncbi:MAG: hypothetical protein LBT05_13950 [Planctomycetaceae bacterium]|jgi:hypothetical protein|nr:hypothetical protein [Planctomycetaceae bacterium]
MKILNRNGTNKTMESYNRNRLYLKSLVVLIFVLLFCLAGCKTGDKGQPTVPFFGGNFLQSPLPQASAGVPADLTIQPQSPIAVDSGMNAGSPAVSSYPSQSYNSIQSPSTFSATGTYAPPNINPAGNLNANPSNGISPASTVYPDRVTVAYEAPPGTNVHAGETVGTLPNAYGSSGTTSTRGTTTGIPPVQNHGLYSPTSTDNSTYGVPYGGNSGQGTPDYRNNPSTFNEMKTRVVQPENGYYTASNGTMFRVIDGKAYTLVQYRETAPALPILSNEADESYGGISTTVPPVSSLNAAKSSLSAGQWTEALGKMILPSYDAIKQTQTAFSPDVAPSVITVGDPREMTILPIGSTTETAPSLDASQYADIGTIRSTATTSAVADNFYDKILDSESQNTVWSLMARQDNDRLLFDVNKAGEISQLNTPKYFALNDPLGAYLNQTNFDTKINSSPFAIAQSNAESPLWNSPPMQTITQSQSAPIILGQSPAMCCPMLFYYVPACDSQW